MHCASDSSLKKTYGTEPVALAAARCLIEALGGDVKVKKFLSLEWQLRIRHKGLPTLSKNFARKDPAADWANQGEGEIAKRELIDCRSADRTTPGDLLRRYAKDRRAGCTMQNLDTARIGKFASTQWRRSGCPCSRAQTSAATEANARSS